MGDLGNSSGTGAQCRRPAAGVDAEHGAGGVPGPHAAAQRHRAGR